MQAVGQEERKVRADERRREADHDEDEGEREKPAERGWCGHGSLTLRLAGACSEVVVSTITIDVVVMVPWS
ncbi:hypothetical protein Ate02nite_75470 [Paractinoplanes tereljensis]|uniref:Uncharacterized protein n=1 Tax=Paractinoplanes tereljensis TaxID=571912 RepID=A0A919TYE5_9ACTN|nr:hypothetical protein Ate02nite_75470 [Actinoplanes tereljensis]